MSTLWKKFASRVSLIAVMVLLTAVSAHALEFALLDDVDPGYYNHGFAINGDYAYVAADFISGSGQDILAEGINIFDISDPENITLLATVASPGFYKDLMIVDNYLLAANHYNGMDVFELVDPVTLVLMDNAPITFAGTFIKVGDVLYVSMEGSGIASLDISNLPNISILDQEACSDYTYECYYLDDYLFVANGWNGLAVFDVSNPADMIYLHDADDNPGENFAGVTGSGDRIYVADNWNGLHTFDCTDPLNLVRLGTDPLAQETILKCRVQDGIIYAAGYDNILYAWYEDPAGPPHTVAATLPLSGSYPSKYPTWFEVTSDRVYLSGVHTFSLVDLIQPDVLTLSADDPVEIPASGGSFDYDLYFHTQSSEVRTGTEYWTTAILPNGNEVGPLFMAPITILPFMTVTATLTVDVPGNIPPGEYEYIGHVGNYPWEVFAEDSITITKLPGMAGVASGWNHSELVFDSETTVARDASLATDFRLHPAMPNPFNPTTTLAVTLPQASELNLVVFDILGRQVAELASGTFAAGHHSFVVDGSSLTSGVYFVQATVPGHVSVLQKITLVK